MKQYKDSIRIAFLKRMLQRLEKQHARIHELLRIGELRKEAAELGARQVNNEHEKLVAELRCLQNHNS